MKRTIINILQAIGIAVIIYYFGFFISMEKDPSNWHTGGRVLAAFIYVWAVFMTYVEKK